MDSRSNCGLKNRVSLAGVEPATYRLEGGEFKTAEILKERFYLNQFVYMLKIKSLSLAAEQLLSKISISVIFPLRYAFSHVST